MNRIISFLWLLTATTLIAFGQTAKSDEKIALDPEVKIGRLDNGLTYYIRHHENPKARADFFIVTSVGALQEEDNQDGLAHFLEHLAFNGLKHFPGKGMLNFLAANGVKFGQNVNAYTSRTRTVYNISNVPLLRDSFIDSVLLILHDWSSYILCEPEELEAERGVIREEWRLGDNSRSRMNDRQIEVEYRGSKYAERDVIGDFKIINTFERQTLVDFYHKWYRPDLQAVMIVGDFDVNKMESRIKEILSPLPKVKNGAKKEIYTLPKQEKTIVEITTDPEIKYVVAKYILKQRFPSDEELQYFSSHKKAFIRNIVANIVSNRLDEVRGDKESDFKTAVMVNSQMYKCRYKSMFTITPKENDKLLPALKDLLVEIKRVEKHGFTQEEFEAAKVSSKKKLGLSIERTPEEVTNTELIGNYIEHFTDNIPFQYPLFLQKKQIEIYDSITLEEVNAIIPEMFIDTEDIILYSMNENETHLAPSEEETLALIKEVNDSNLAPYKGSESTEFSLRLEGLKGSKIVKETPLGYYDAKEWVLANGIKVIWTPTKESQKEMDMVLTAENRTGFSIYDDPQMGTITNGFIPKMGAKGAKNSDIKKILLNTNFRNTIDIRRRSASLSSISSNSEFEQALSSLYISLTDPYFDEEEVDRYLKSNLKTLSLRDKQDYNSFKDSARVVLFNGHPWAVALDSAALLRATPEKMMETYLKQFSRMNNFTFFISGTMPEEDVKPLIEKYIGSLPVSGERLKLPKDNYKYRKGKNECLGFGKEKQIPKSKVDYTFYGEVKYDKDSYMALKYLTQILRERYMSVIREEKGGAYYVMVTSDIDPDLKQYEVNVTFETDPKLVDELVVDVRSEMEKLAKTPPTAQEMDKINKYLLKANSETKEIKRKYVSYWMNKTKAMYKYGVSIDEEEESVINSVTAEQVSNLAKKISKGSSFTSVYSEKYLK